MTYESIELYKRSIKIFEQLAVFHIFAPVPKCDEGTKNPANFKIYNNVSL